MVRSPDDIHEKLDPSGQMTARLTQKAGEGGAEGLYARLLLCVRMDRIAFFAEEIARGTPHAWLVEAFAYSIAVEIAEYVRALSDDQQKDASLLVRNISGNLSKMLG